MTHIYVTRHGETDWNARSIFRGRADIELNATGQKQAELLADYLKDVEFNAIFCSPLKRALRTAQLITGLHHGIDIETTDDLIDLNYGDWQGVSKDKVKNKYPELYNQWEQEPAQAKIPGGESLGDVRERVSRFINIIVRTYEGNIMVVSHRVVVKILILTVLGLDLSHFLNIKHDPCGLTLFKYNGGRFVLEAHNDTCFMKSLKKSAIEDF